MSIFHVIILAIVQGLAELLPVSSSAHVVVAEKLMGLDPSSPDMTLLLVMLHTGTMFAVIVYFWNQWKKTYFASVDAFKRFAIRVIWATALTGVVGEVIKKVIEKTLFKGAQKAEIELLFGRLDLIAPALAAAGVLILIAGLLEKRQTATSTSPSYSTLGRGEGSVTMRQAGWMGFVQGLALPFRGFSRSGSTISTGMLVGASKERAERFSFALAVVLTPAVVGLEALRLIKASHENYGGRRPHRSSRKRRIQHPGYGIFVSRGAGSAEMAKQLAGARTLVPLRNLLSVGFSCCLLSTSRRLLGRRR